jgi:glycosyltransferase involved in cell wall biosynthesis
MSKGSVGEEVLIVSLCSVAGRTPSGGDRLAVELARHWPSAGDRPVVLTNAAGKQQWHDIGQTGFTIAVQGPVGRPLSSRLVAWSLGAVTAPLAAFRLVRQAMRQGRRPIMFASSPFPPDVMAGVAARLAGATWIQSWQLVLPPPWSGSSRSRVRTALSYLSQQFCLALARRWCQKLIIPNRVMAAEAQRRGFRLDQIHVNGYAVDHDEMAAGVHQDGVAQFDGIFVGRFHAQKGLSDLLAIWKLVQQARPQASLAIIGDGDGPEAAAFKAELDRFPSETMHRLGVLVGPEKYAAMRRGRVFLFPSHHESWGHVAVEAMACGLPVVGYALPSSTEVFGDAMVMVPRGDVPAFAGNVLRLLTNEGMRGRYQRRGQQLAERFDWGVIAKRFFDEVTRERSEWRPPGDPDARW